MESLAGCFTTRNYDVIVLLKFATYGGFIAWMSITGGGTYHGITVHPCDAHCFGAQHPVGSYWVYRNGQYLAAYQGRVLKAQRTSHGLFH